MTEPGDIEIINRVLSGKIDDFELLAEEHKNQVFAIVRKRVPPEDVEEVVQKVFIAAFRALSAFAQHKPFGNWLAGIAVRRCCDYWRQNGETRKARLAAPDHEHLDWLERAAHCDSLEKFSNLARQREAGELVRWSLAQLPPEDQALLEMIYFEDWPLKAAAAALNWGLAKTKIRAMRAKMKMRQLIAKLPEMTGK